MFITINCFNWLEYLKKECRLHKIHGIGPKKAQLLKCAGFSTVYDIASASIADLTVIGGFSDVSANKLIVKAKALIEQRIIPLTVEKSFPSREQLVLIDIETDLQASFVWVICAVLSDGTVKQWYAPTKKETKHIIDEFSKWLNEIYMYIDKPVLGSWSSFDFRVLEKMDGGIRETLKKFQIVDCLSEVRNCYAFPISSLGLKDVSAYLGYKYDEKDIDGFLAASLYMQFQRRGGMSKELEEKLLQYNIDDVLAMWFVLDKTFYNKSEKELNKTV